MDSHDSIAVSAELHCAGYGRRCRSGIRGPPGEIRNAASIIDYVFRWMALQFDPEYKENQIAEQQELAMPGLIDEVKKKGLSSLEEKSQTTLENIPKLSLRTKNKVYFPSS